MKQGPSLPGWAVGLIIAIFLVAVVGVGYKFIAGGGPLPDSQAPKEAFQKPSYAAGGDYSGVGTKDGKPISGDRAGSSASAPSSDSRNPYAGYGGRP